MKNLLILIQALLITVITILTGISIALSMM